MAKRRQKHSNRKTMAILFFICVVLIGIITHYKDGYGRGSSVEIPADGKAMFHFIDVGQGDSTLITSGEGAVVIDVGSVSEGENVSDYILSYTDSLDYLILTHPHEDHMGCADVILETVEVKNVILPAAASDAAFFSRFLDAAEETGTNVIEAVPGDAYTVGEMVFTVLAPLSYADDNLNNCSAVIRVDVGETSALFTGDAEAPVESALLERWGRQLDCDLYQVGHHGSGTSSTKEFLRALSPEIAIISCGEGNSYGHPHGNVVDALQKVGADVYRTDRMGDLVFYSDGTTLLRIEE